MITVRPITSSQTQGASIQNVSYINAVNTILNMSSNRQTFYGASGAILQQSTNVDTATTPTWTTIYTFPTTLGQTLTGFMELPNGEALAITTQSSQAVNLSHVYKSTGWSVNKLTATWAQVHITVGGNITSAYSLHEFAYGNDGTVVIGESGTQTTGGAGNVATDVTKARRVWLSTDFGSTFNLIFDVYAYGQSQGVAYPAGVNVHGVSYDQDWGRIWVCYGDNTGDGKTIAGAGNTQVVYSDDSGVTWNKLPTPAQWSNVGQLTSTLQHTSCAIFNNSIVFTHDLTAPLGPLVYPKNGYRTLGEPHVGPQYASGVNGIIRKGAGDVRAPSFFVGQAFITQTAEVTWVIDYTTDDGFTWGKFTQAIPLQTPAIATLGASQVLGPTVNGKLVITTGHYINNDNTKKTVIADFVGTEDIVPDVANLVVDGGAF